jgi:hypothetical protein
MAGSAKDRFVYPLEKRVVNPVVMLAWRPGIPLTVRIDLDTR